MVDVRNGGGEASSVTALNSPDPDAAQPDASARSGTSNSANPREDSPTSKAPSGASSTRASPPAAAASDLRQPAQTANGTPTPPEQTQPAQPTAATTSSSATAPAKEVKEPPAAPYGTRSRNRPGTTRPNYAEDVEMDFEMAPASSNGNCSGPPSRGSLATESGQSAAAGGKKGSGAGQGNAPWGNSGPNAKDNAANANIPGTSTFVASPASSAGQPPKRRKNAASHATNGSLANAGAPSQAGARRANTAGPAANGTRESTMMTFESSGARLKGDHLETDDGRTVSINGKFAVVLRVG